MAGKKKQNGGGHVFSGEGPVVSQPITRTLETNFMPYAMSVIVSRAIPEIDGFKPSHRKLLYTMYKMGLLGGQRIKSANVVGQTMKLNPHGDAAIYDTMVRLSRGNQALLHPFVDSKGNFGKCYSRDMAYAASRYTEVKLDTISEELFRDIDNRTVEFVDNYDNTMKEPALLPVSFPTVLVNLNSGIAVGMASSICSFNLAEVCDTAIALIKSPEHDILSTLKAPDFACGGRILYNRDTFAAIYKTGRGSFRVRAKWEFDREDNRIEITEIPPTTTVEAIIDKIVDMVKSAKIREISDVRDETDLSGLKIAVDLKRGADPERLMQRLLKNTTLEDSFTCNFNVLINGVPRVMGVAELLSEWTAFRMTCVKNRLRFVLEKCREKLHLLRGLTKILLDIDKAVKIVRETDEESEVVPNLMIGFGIDEVQADYVAEIKLRHLNREYILKRTGETASLEDRIAELEGQLGDDGEIKKLIVTELREIKAKYGKPRNSIILYDAKAASELPEDDEPDYPVTLFLTKEGYFKKITPQSLRTAGEQKVKEGDSVIWSVEAGSGWDMLFFTDQRQVYKARVSDFDDMKASQLGDYIPAKLSFDKQESVVFCVATKDYNGFLLFFFRNGKTAKVELGAYATKTNRRKLVGAYGEGSEIASAFFAQSDTEYVLTASSGRALILHSGAISLKTTKNTKGVAVMTLKRGQTVLKAEPYCEGMFRKPDRHRVRSLPAAGQLPLPEESLGGQMTFK